METAYKPKGGITVKDVPADKFIATLAQHFKNSNVIEVPAWADYAKTACFKEHTPLNPDWFYIRAGMQFFFFQLLLLLLLFFHHTHCIIAN